jgi:hypothetical protein
MNNKDEKIQNILDSLNDIQRATPGPFFYTRVNARLLKEQKTAWEGISNLIARPVVAIGGLCIIIAVNMLVIFSQTNEVSSANDATELALADEYTIATASFYDYENLEAR